MGMGIDDLLHLLTNLKFFPLDAGWTTCRLVVNLHVDDGPIEKDFNDQNTRLWIKLITTLHERL